MNWKNIKVSLSCLTSFLLILSVGMTLTFSSPAFPDINNGNYGFKLSDDLMSWLASYVQLFALPGTFLVAPIMDKYGRKFAIAIAILPQAVGWLLIVLAKNVAMLAIGRAITGVAQGMVFASIYVYVSEVTSKETRGILSMIGPLCLESGCLVVNLLGAFVSWRWIAVTAIALTTASSLCVLFMYETPRWLVSKGLREEAATVMEKLWIFDNDKFIPNEIANMEANVKLVSSLSMWQGILKLISHPLRKPFAITMILLIFQQLTGISYIDSYTVIIFQEAIARLKNKKNAFNNPNYQASIMSTANILGNLTSLFFINRYGRRGLLITSAIIQALSLGVFGLYYFLVPYFPSLIDDYLFWLPLACLLGFSFGYCFAFGSIPFFLISEVIPIQARSVANSAGMFISSFCGFFATKVYPTVHVIPNYGLYWICASIGIASIFFVIFFVPETKGRSLEDIQKQWYVPTAVKNKNRDAIVP